MSIESLPTKLAVEKWAILAQNGANASGIYAQPILALIYQESRGKHLVSRFEDQYIYTVDIPGFAQSLGQTVMTESVQQRTSYGLMQIMGGTARWLGFKGYLSELYQPSVNVMLGAKYFSRLLGKAKSLEDAIASYNAGSVRLTKEGKYINQEYVDSVKRWLDEIGRWYKPS